MLNKNLHKSRLILKIPSCCSWIQNGQSHLLVGVHNENCSCSQGYSISVLLIRIYHVQFRSQLAVYIRNNRVRKGGFLRLGVQLDVQSPFLVRLHAVTRQGDNFNIPLAEFRH